VITYFGAGPKPATFPRQPANAHHSSSGRMSSLALAADGNRMYAGCFAGVWRSEDGGENWTQLTWPQPSPGSPQGDIPGALYAPHVFDIATSPSDANLVLVSARDSQFVNGRDGIYRSTDAGATWTLVLKSTSFPTTTSFNIAFAPDDASLVYAAGTEVSFSPIRGIFAISRDAGATWNTTTVGTSRPGSSWMPSRNRAIPTRV
jgi:photosystem II stability/assembly factor-like uncharacterized protein